MNVDDAFDDRQAEPRSRGFRAERPVKAVEDALTLFGIDPGAVVADFDDGSVALGVRADFDASPVRACSEWRCR